MDIGCPFAGDLALLQLSPHTMVDPPPNTRALIIWMGLDPSLRADRVRTSQILNAAPLVLDSDRIWSLAQSTSRATAIDNVARAFLAKLFGGLVQGVHIMLCMTDMGISLPLLDCPMYGLYKRGPRHLCGSYRPLVPASAVPSSESRLAN